MRVNKVWLLDLKTLPAYEKPSLYVAETPLPHSMHFL